MSRYDDMIHMTRPQYDDLPPMPVSDRAAQFSPFAALVGYDLAVAETERLTDSKRELSEDEAAELGAMIARLSAMADEHPQVTVVYFVPDKLKEGGEYAEKKGRLKTVDGYNKELVFADGDRIRMDDIYSIGGIGDE